MLLVFALDSMESFNTAIAYYHQMEQHRSLSSLPVILVGTQDTCSHASPRVISEEDGRSIAMRYNMLNYIETNAPYGHKVEELFKEGKSEILCSKWLKAFSRAP